MNDGFPTNAFIPFIKQFPELFQIHNQVEDKYEEFYQYLGITRAEMLELMKGITSVDLLSDNDNLDYMS